MTPAPPARPGLRSDARALRRARSRSSGGRRAARPARACRGGRCRAACPSSRRTAAGSKPQPSSSISIQRPAVGHAALQQHGGRAGVADDVEDGLLHDAEDGDLHGGIEPGVLELGELAAHGDAGAAQLESGEAFDRRPRGRGRRARPAAGSTIRRCTPSCSAIDERCSSGLRGSAARRRAAPGRAPSGPGSSRRGARARRGGARLPAPRSASRAGAAAARCAPRRGARAPRSRAPSRRRDARSRRRMCSSAVPEPADLVVAAGESAPRDRPRRSARRRCVSASSGRWTLSTMPHAMSAASAARAGANHSERERNVATGIASPAERETRRPSTGCRAPGRRGVGSERPFERQRRRRPAVRSRTRAPAAAMTADRGAIGAAASAVDRHDGDRVGGAVGLPRERGDERDAGGGGSPDGGGERRALEAGAGSPRARTRAGAPCGVHVADAVGQRAAGARTGCGQRLQVRGAVAIAPSSVCEVARSGRARCAGAGARRRSGRAPRAGCRRARAGSGG